MHRWYLGVARRQVTVHMVALSVFMGGALLCLVSGDVFAADATAKAQLTIDSSECVVDVVQDGSGQNLQVPSKECDVVLPNLVVPVLGQSPTQLPFAGNDAAVPVVVRQLPLDTDQETPTPVASVSSQRSGVESAGVTTAMVAGIGVVAAATAVGVDAALFELSHSKTAAKWAKERVARRLPRHKARLR